MAMQLHAGNGTQQNDDQAIKWYQMAASQGMPQAQTNLALLYMNRAKQDYKESAKLLQMAANNGFATAQMRLAFYYQSGIGVDKDISKALYWYQKAAEQDYPEAKQKLELLRSGQQ